MPPCEESHPRPFHPDPGQQLYLSRLGSNTQVSPIRFELEHEGHLWSVPLSETRQWNLPDASGTLALANQSPVEEVPAGLIDGVNTSFLLSYEPCALSLYLNGLLLQAGIDYALTGLNLTTAFAPSDVGEPDRLWAVYTPKT